MMLTDKYFYQLANGSMIDMALIYFTKKVERRTMEGEDYYWAVVKHGSPDGSYFALTEKEFNDINRYLQSFYSNVNIIIKESEQYDQRANS